MLLSIVVIVGIAWSVGVSAWHLVQLLFGPLLRDHERPHRCPDCPAGWK